MWTVMMIAMMLPAMTPALRDLPGATRARVAGGYFGVWVVCGLAVYPLGLALAELAMREDALARLAPALSGAVLVGAGLLQRSGWKSRQLDCCRAARRHPPLATRAAWRQGFALGVRCCACCAPLTAALLAVGVMDLGAMAAATVAISLERLAPRGQAVARISGVLLIGAGLVLLARGLR
jgi:predicted metal-binding membrane protein